MNEQVSPANDFFYKDGKKINRQKCTVRTRVMGYLRNTGSYNIGKKTEFYSRKYFDVSDVNNNIILQARENAKFNNQYK